MVKPNRLLKPFLPALIQVPMPVWARRIALLPRLFHYGQPSLLAVRKRRKNEPIVAVLNDLNFDGLSSQ